MTSASEDFDPLFDFICIRSVFSASLSVMKRDELALIPSTHSRLSMRQQDHIAEFFDAVHYTESSRNCYKSLWSVLGRCGVFLMKVQCACGGGSSHLVCYAKYHNYCSLSSWLRSPPNSQPPHARSETWSNKSPLMSSMLDFKRLTSQSFIGELQFEFGLEFDSNPDEIKWV